MRFSKATVILNPKAGAGKALRASRRMLAQLKSCVGRVDVVRTREEREGAALARKAAETGSDLIVAVGGDGTVNEVVNGLFRSARGTERKCLLAIVPGGASSSLARELGIPPGPEAANLIARGTLRAIDLILMQWRTPRGERKERLATTIVHFGFGGAVAGSVRSPMKRLGGFLAFATVAAYQLLRYKSNRMTVKVDEEQITHSRLLCTIVANTRWEGGGMCVAPQARPDDGLLDVVLVKDLPVPSRLRHFPKVYRGAHLGLSEVAFARGRIVSIKSEHVIPFEFDGECGECTECRGQLIPKVLSVLVPKEQA